MDIESVMEQWLYDKFDVGGGREVDEVIDCDYRYLPRISGLYPYLRGRFWFLGLAQVATYSAILSCGFYSLIRTTILVYSHDLNLAVQYAHFAILYFLAITVLICANKNRNKINNIHLILRDNYYTYDDGWEIKEQASRNKLLRKIKIMLVLIIPAFLAFAFISIIVIPLIEVYYGYERKYIEGLDMRLPVPLCHPYSKDSPVIFCLYFLLSVFSSSITAAVVCSVDVVFIFVSLSVVFQYKRLHKSIENLQLRAENIYKIRFPKQQVSEEKMLSCYHHCIKQNVEHHLKIETVFNQLFDTGYLMLGLGILLGSIIIAASLLGFVFGDAPPSLYISSSLLVVGETANMAMLCHLGQQISDHSYDTVSALYNTNWDTAPKQVVSSIKIMIEKSKCPLEVRAFGVWPVNHELFSSIINTSYSYFNILLGAKERFRQRGQGRLRRK